MIQNEKEVLKFLNIPSIPKREWDGKSSFKHGVAIVALKSSELAYAVATYDKERDNAPKIKKVFSHYPFVGVSKIFVVPSYMDDDVDSFDMDDESKERARMILEEAKDIENEGVIDTSVLPENEYCYDFIHNDEEAIAYIKSWNRRNGIKRGAIPKNHESIITKLAAMYMQDKK